MQEFFMKIYFWWLDAQPLQEAIIQAYIWWAGAIFVGILFLLITIMVAYGLKLFSERVAKGLLCIVRFKTAQYWVNRMEKEGLTIMQTEYRKMVAERKPKTVREMYEVSQLEEDRLLEIKRQQSEAAAEKESTQ